MLRQTVCRASWLCMVVLLNGARAGDAAHEEFDSVLRIEPDAAHGQRLFDTCAACHGANGAGATDGTIPSIAGQHFRVVAGELVDFRHDRRWDERMQNFTDKHHLEGARDVADVAYYISRMPPVRVNREHAPSGRLIEDSYARRCASCHGAKAEGDNLKRVPRLAGQHREYLLAQFHYIAEGRRPNSAASHGQLFRNLGQADSVDLAGYLSTLEP
jgi:cytochrome c553